MNARKFTQSEVDLIHRTMMVDPSGRPATKDDLDMFIQTCERTGLDPFARQIMPSSRNTKKGERWVTQWTWIVTIDGLRKIAVDSGDYEGQEGPWWCGEDGVWKEVWTLKTPPLAAKVLVHRNGFRTGLSGIAKYESYVQKTKEGKPNSVWSNLGDHMTAKCAEALALRRAYPNEMAGLYTSDEMAQAGFEATAPVDKPEAPVVAEWTDDQHCEALLIINDSGQTLMDAGFEEDEINAAIQKVSQHIGDAELGFEKWSNRTQNYIAAKIKAKKN